MESHLPKRLPRASKAFVPKAKLATYLLNPAHPEGGPKARFFLAHGHTRTNPRRLEAALIAHAQTN